MGTLSIDITIGGNTANIMFTESLGSMRGIEFNDDFNNDFK